MTELGLRQPQTFLFRDDGLVPNNPLPMLVYLDLSPAGRTLLQGAPKLSAWLARMRLRPAATATRFPAEQKAI